MGSWPARRKSCADFRKDHQVRRRQKDLTRKFARDEHAEDKLVKSERITGKGDLTRKRTIIGTEDNAETGGFKVLRDVDWHFAPRSGAERSRLCRASSWPMTAASFAAPSAGF